MDRSDQSRQRAKVRNPVIRNASLVSSTMNDDANHSDSLRSLDVSSRIIAYVNAGFRFHSEFLCDEGERLVAGLDPRRVLTRDYNRFEQIVKRDLSYPLPLHPRCSIAVRDHPKLVASPFELTHRRLRVSKRRTIRRVDPPVLKSEIVDPFWVHPLQSQFLEQCLPPYVSIVSEFSP